MEFIGAELQRYRRFEGPVRVRLLEDLIAFIGQNESGKTSFLEALQELNSREPIPDRDQTRRSEGKTKIKVDFVLEEDDYKYIDDIDGADNIDKCSIIKQESGEFRINLDPRPDHETIQRKKIRSELEKFQKYDIFQEKLGGRSQRHISNSISALNDDSDYLGKNSISQLQDAYDTIDKLTNNVDDGEFDVSFAEEVKKRLQYIIDHEQNSSPELARNRLAKRIPKFILFSDNDRSLKTRYDINEQLPNPEGALENLAELAELNLANLQDAIESDNIAWRDDQIDDANEKLRDVFSEAWVRSDVFPVLGVNRSVLHINVRTPGGESRAPIDQRSEGLRWFIALIAFLNQQRTEEDPILLVDEAESHLSYDAQAELIEVLEAQEIAQKIIYTTHSAGCLPSDLGRGIRPVIQQDGEKSDIKNGFWEDAPGFKPIMMVMGLSPLAFSVSRNSMIGEGASETILLPSLLREAIDENQLHYQVAPGASSASNTRIQELLSESGRSVILLDGDEHGIQMKEEFIEAGVSDDNIKTYGDFTEYPYVLEDFVVPEVYVEAVNMELSTYQDPTEEVSEEELPEIGRDSFIDEWCDNRGLDNVVKPNVCQRIVDMASTGRSILDPDKKDALIDVHQWADGHFVSADNV